MLICSSNTYITLYSNCSHLLCSHLLCRCEYNHHHSPYLAEPWNSFSSLTYCIAAVWAYLYQNKNMETHIVLSLVSLFMIGIGSFCFHGTLTYRMQLLDELPMVCEQ